MKPLLDKKQLAELLNVQVGTVEGLTAAREIPITWVGKHARYDPDEIAAWLAANTERPAGDMAPVLGLFGPKKPSQPQPSRPPKAPRPPAAPAKPRPPSGPRRVDGEVA